VRKRGVAAFACLAVVAAADLVLSRKRPPWILVGLFDEPAHLATAGVILANLRPSSPEWAAGFIGGAALPDLDHVPLALSRVHPNVDDPRPVTHCLLAVAPLFVAARLQAPGPRRDALAGAAAGTLAHFARDLAVGTGVGLLQPLTRHSFKLPYPLYVAGLVALATRAAQAET
jgi:inner membrane protein